MKNSLKANARKFKNHVARNKVAYAATTIAFGAIWLQQSNTKAFYAFLESKGIDPMEYYNSEYYEELKNS